MKKNKISEFHIFAFAAHGNGISGGDRIWIELTRRWCKKFPIVIHTWKEGQEMGERQKLIENQESSSKNQGLKYKLYNIPLCNFGFVSCYLTRIVKGIWVGLTLNLTASYQLPATYIYNASEFWMDSIPCIILKMRYPQIRWIASWYQTAPNPLKGFASGKRENTYKFTALLYWLVQLPIKPLVSKYADKVVVNNDEEKKQFPKQTVDGNTIVLIGAVPLEDIKKYRSRFTVHSSQRKYDAVFQGRFHAQKGVVELIDIWKKVVDRNPKAKLAMIGDGPLMENVKLQISNAKLENNVKLFGYVFDGPEKYRIFSQSKIVVHPAFFDSGGMASAEAMAFGVPAVGFDLPSYKSYYPKGMVKVSQNNLDAFAKAILDLLSNDSKRKKFGDEAKKMIEENYSWDTRANEVLKKILFK